MSVRVKLPLWGVCGQDQYLRERGCVTLGQDSAIVGANLAAPRWVAVLFPGREEMTKLAAQEDSGRAEDVSRRFGSLKVNLVDGNGEMAERQSIQELLWFRVSVGEDAAPKGLVPSARFTTLSLIFYSAKKVHFLQQKTTHGKQHVPQAHTPMRNWCIKERFDKGVLHPNSALFVTRS